MKDIYILGSINYDLVIHVDKLPLKGETTNGHDFIANSGGKGANQAVASSKLGAKAHLIGAIGDDFFGRECLKALDKAQVDTAKVQVVAAPTGSAMIIVENNDNRIIIEHGANYLLDSLSVKESLKDINEGDLLLTQMEIKADSLITGLKLAREKGAINIFNPAPCEGITEEILQEIDIIIPNENEAEKLSGIQVNDVKSLKLIENDLYLKGIKEVIVTLGDKGCYYRGKIYPPYNEFKVVDTTAAGDTFIGALASRLSLGENIEDSLYFAQMAAAITTSRKGAQMSIPYLDEVLRNLRSK